MASSESNGYFDDEDTMEMLSANLPHNAFLTSTPDPRLEKARQDAERTNQITPVLKEELRLQILNRRLQQGKPEIETTPVEPRQYELTEDEKEKKERRKAQNRRAAKKCRDKRKMKNLSDAEKYNIMKETQQRLKNDIILLRHKEKVMKEFCIEHILQANCQHASNADSEIVRLHALLEREVTHCVTQPQEELQIPSYPHHTVASTSVHSLGMSIHQDSRVGRGVTHTSCVKNVSSDDVFDREKHAATAQLLTLAVEEISTLLPPDTELSLSDQSLESTSPIVSPTTLFSTISQSPISGTVLSSSTASSSYFKHDLTPNSSSSAAASSATTTDTSQEMDTSMEIVQTGSQAVYYCTMPSTSALRTAQFIGKGENSLGHYTDKFSPVSQSGGGQDTILNSLAEQHDLEQPIWADTSGLEDEDSRDIAGVSPAITSATFIPEMPAGMDILHYLSQQEHHQHNSHSFSHCEGEAADQTVPISPLTPLSPLSPNLARHSLSPTPYSADHHSQYSPDISTPSPVSTPGRVPSSSGSVVSTVTVSTAKLMTPARPVIRRTSSTASVPSPYLSHQLSNSSLSPPPSVPSPSSHGVPESPSIFSGYVACDDSLYHPQFSPISSAASDEFNQVRAQDVNGEDFNSSPLPQ